MAKHAASSQEHSQWLAPLAVETLGLDAPAPSVIQSSLETMTEQGLVTATGGAFLLGEVIEALVECLLVVHAILRLRAGLIAENADCPPSTYASRRAAHMTF